MSLFSFVDIDESQIVYDPSCGSGGFLTFAGYEKDPMVLSKFELGQNGRGNVASVTREVLFVERIIRVLRNGGKADIVLPQGIFTNRKPRACVTTSDDTLRFWP